VADFNIVPASLFQRKYPSLPDDSSTIESDGNSLSSYESFGSLKNVKSFSDITGQWLCMEATLPPSKPSDCPGHFYDNTKALPHSVMLFHNGDLVGKAISEFTGLDLPFKRCDFGQEPGMRMLSWTVRYFIRCIDMFTFFVLLCSQSLKLCCLLRIIKQTVLA